MGALQSLRLREAIYEARGLEVKKAPAAAAVAASAAAKAMADKPAAPTTN